MTTKHGSDHAPQTWTVVLFHDCQQTVLCNGLEKNWKKPTAQLKPTFADHLLSSFQTTTQTHVPIISSAQSNHKTTTATLFLSELSQQSPFFHGCQPYPTIFFRVGIPSGGSVNRQDLLSATTKCRPLVHYFMEGDLSAIGLVALRDCAWSSGSPPLFVILLL